MLVKQAEVMGFCSGVRRAFRIAMDAAEKYGRLQTDGQVVHNPQAVAELVRHGVHSSPELEYEYPILVRAHGAPPKKLEQWRERGLPVIDATCPHVAANQRLTAGAAKAGEYVLFAGDPEHAETRAVMGAVSRGKVVTGVEELLSTDVEGRGVLLAQTTFSVKLFQKLAELAERRWPEIRIADTICRATRERQDAVRRLARDVPAVVVVGGKESANTRRLTETIRAAGAEAFQIEREDELPLDRIQKFAVIGLTSGASTPDWVTKQVYDILSELPSEKL